MADEKDLSKRVGLTRSKAALIGVLAVVLVGVIYIQYGPAGTENTEEVVAAVDESSASTSPPPSPAATSSRSPAAAPAVAASAVSVAPAESDEASGAKLRAAQLLDAERWKAPDVDQIVQYDPFALPSAFPQPLTGANAQGLTSEGIVAADAATRASELADAVAKLHTELESLRQRGVSVIVKQHDKYVAMIGDRTVHVGDEINGFTVTAIEPDGVRVEKKVQE